MNNKDIHDFLILNGFKETSDEVFETELCTVKIILDTYTIIDKNVLTGGHTYSDDLSIYWLIGFLTYYGFMKKNYKNLNE